ncbi:MAG: hypothetical protein WA252_01695 [Candidatus Sulfotelmatobacter sp.]
MLDRLDLIEEWLSPMRSDVMEAENCLHFSPMLTIDFAAFVEGRGWRTYSQLRRARRGEDAEPAILPGTKEQSDVYEAWRAEALRDLPEEARHRFLVGFAIASGLDSRSIFAELKRLAESGEFFFANIWRLVDPMQIGAELAAENSA